MALSLLVAGTYPAIRAALSTALTVARLPDTTIALSIYAAAAEREALARLDGLALDDLDDDQTARLTDAAIYLCAARLALALPSITQESVGQGDMAYRAQPLAPDELAKQLRARASAELAVVNGQTGRPAVFALAAGGRAQSRSIIPLLPDGSVVAGQG